METAVKFKKLPSPFAGYFFSRKERRTTINDFFTPLFSINGFTIYLQCFDVYNSHDDYVSDVGVYMIRPNHSPYWFVFRNLESAREFCYLFSNVHSDKFWSRHFVPSYRFPVVVCLTIEMLPNVAFNIDDDLPF